MSFLDDVHEPPDMMLPPLIRYPETARAHLRLLQQRVRYLQRQFQRRTGRDVKLAVDEPLYHALTLAAFVLRFTLEREHGPEKPRVTFERTLTGKEE